MSGNFDAFREKIESLTGKMVVFREYSFVAQVLVIAVTTSKDDFTITFKIVDASAKEEPITIGSQWTNATLFTNGFSIAYVGSQMIIDENAVRELMKKFESSVTDRIKEGHFLTAVKKV